MFYFHTWATGQQGKYPHYTAQKKVILKVSGDQYRWLASGYDLEIGHFKKWLAWWLTDR